MHNKSPINLQQLFEEVLGKKVKDLNLPPPSFSIMKTTIIDFNIENKSLITKIPVLESWLNPYSSMQGGMIVGAIDNAIGPLSLLVGPFNVTRKIETEYIKPITLSTKYIYIIAKLVEQSGKRMFFEAKIVDEFKKVYVKAKATHWIIKKSIS